MQVAENANARKMDRLLVAIVAGIILLVAATFVLVLSRPEPAYQSDDTPEGVAHNYLLALRREEFERAYGYLSRRIVRYPSDADDFEHDVVGSYSWVFRLEEEVSFAVLSSRISGNRATVTVEESRFSGGNLFDSGRYESDFDVRLRLENGRWRIYESGAYWVNCWSNSAVQCR